jgi:hypothetical protein
LSPQSGLERGCWKSRLCRVSIAEMSDYGENLRVLIEARVIPGPVPEPYDRVIEELSSDEVEALISIKARFDAASEGGDAGFVGMVLPL